jgi:hypothetical protein
MMNDERGGWGLGMDASVGRLAFPGGVRVVWELLAQRRGGAEKMIAALCFG